MTDYSIHPPTQNVIARLDMLQKGATVLMLSFFGIGTALALIQGGQRIPLIIGLHLINMGVTMVIAVGAVANHKAILQQLAASDRRMDHLVSAAADEVADQRGGHQR